MLHLGLQELLCHQPVLFLVALGYSGIFGAVVGGTVISENVGLVGLTLVGSRRVVQVSAAYMIFFAIFAKLGAIFYSIPVPLYAIVACILCSIVDKLFHSSFGSTGMSYMRFVASNTSRNTVVLAFIMLFGIMMPGIFTTHGGITTDTPWFDCIATTILSSSCAVMLFVGVVLDYTLERHGRDGRFTEHQFQGRVGDRDFYGYPSRLVSCLRYR